MQIINKIDKLISQLNKLKPELSDNLPSNEKKFTELLKSNIEANYAVTDTKFEAKPYPKSNVRDAIPNWVDPDYGYDPNNPRKPNMRELMQAISGKDLEDLHNETNANWKPIRRQASDLLYGVIGANEDTRDWPSIMASEDILTKAREQTGAMYKPEVDIQSNFDENGALVEQIAIIKDSNNNTLTSLTTDTAATEEALLNFGATKESIPTNLEERINPDKFDGALLAFLKNFDNSPTSIQQLIVQNASEVITKKIAQEIPLDELAKL